MLGNVLVLGDLNSRTGTLSDIDVQSKPHFCTLNGSNTIENTVLIDNDDDITPDFINSLGHSASRRSQDKDVNDFGRKLIDLCQASNLVILNGRVGDDKNEGKYTFFNHRGKSIVDYCLVDKQLLYHCTNFHVENFNIFSDHAPIVMHLNIFVSHDNNSNNKTFITSVYKWKNEAKDDYIHETASVDFISKLADISHKFDDPNIDINSIVENFSHLILDAAINHKKNIFHTDHSVHIYDKNNDWFDNECKSLQKDFKNAQHNYLTHGDDVSRKLVCTLRNRYRKICRIKKRKYETNCAIDLANLNKKDPKKFWKCLKRKSKNINNKCDFHSFF